MRMWFLVLALAFLPEPAHAQGGPEGAKTGRSFVDKFTTLDKARWYISHGWSNGPHQNCTWLDANVHVDASAMLSLTNVPSWRPAVFLCRATNARVLWLWHL